MKSPFSERMLNTLITGRNEVVAKVMFLQVCVCPQGGGCLPQDQADTPAGPGRHPPPGPGRHPPWDQTETPPGPGRHPPPREADSSIRSTSGRYASYWNAFLLPVLIYSKSKRTRVEKVYLHLKPLCVKC